MSRDHSNSFSSPTSDVEAPLTDDDRYRMALAELSRRCGMVRDETKFASEAWISIWLKGLGNSADLLKESRHDFLPVADDIDESVGADELVQRAHSDLSQFQVVLERASRLERLETEDSDTFEAKSHALRGACSSVRTLLNDFATVSEHRNIVLHSGDTTDIASQQVPDTRPERYQWEYTILEQLVEYFDNMSQLFGKVAENEDA